MEAREAPPKSTVSRLLRGTLRSSLRSLAQVEQILNAEYFKNLGLARVLEQSNLSPKSLTKALLSLYEDRNLFADNFKAHPVRSSAEKIAEILAKTAHKN